MITSQGPQSYAPSTCSYELALRDLSLQVHLGCSDQEQLESQEVRISVVLKFQQPPLACETDRIEDTVCYNSIAQILKKRVMAQSYRTIENLASVCYHDLKEKLPSVWIHLKLHKVRPPIEGLIGGAVFSIKDS